MAAFCSIRRCCFFLVFFNFGMTNKWFVNGKSDGTASAAVVVVAVFVMLS